MPIGTSPAQRAAARRSSRWSAVAIAGAVLFAIAVLTAYYFGTVQEELLASSGRIVDCGTMFGPVDSAECSGATGGDAIAFVGALALGLVAIAAIVVGILKSRDPRRRRR